MEYTTLLRLTNDIKKEECSIIQFDKRRYDGEYTIIIIKVSRKPSSLIIALVSCCLTN
jgi:hypothetical protein